MELTCDVGIDCGCGLCSMQSVQIKFIQGSPPIILLHDFCCCNLMRM